MTKRKFVAKAMDRWPRTFLFGLLVFSTVVTCAVMLASTYLFGIYGPIYIGIVGFVYIAIAGVWGDIKDRKKP